jgi:hypothetical protein
MEQDTHGIDQLQRLLLSLTHALRIKNRAMMWQRAMLQAHVTPQQTDFVVVLSQSGQS